MNALTTQSGRADMSLGMLDPAAFEHMQRVGKMLALSPLFPQHLRNGSAETALANGVLVMNMAIRLREDPLTVAQNIYFVGGRPGWSSSYMIGKANQHGVFRDPIDWDITGEGDNLTVTAFATLAKTGKRVETSCGMAMAKAEGWTKNPKYQSMPKTMLRYRSAAALIRFYCPEVMIGIPAQAEVEMPMRNVSPDYDLDESPVAEPDKPAREAAPAKQAAAEKPKAEPKPAPKVEPRQESRPEAKESTQANEPGPDHEQFMGLYDLITSELVSSTVEEVESMYGPQIEQMERFAPDLHRKLRSAMAEVA